MFGRPASRIAPRCLLGLGQLVQEVALAHTCQMRIGLPGMELLARFSSLLCPAAGDLLPAGGQLGPQPFQCLVAPASGVTGCLLVTSETRSRSGGAAGGMIPIALHQIVGSRGSRANACS